MSSRNAEFSYVDRADLLEQFCKRIASASWIALDTEFIREKSYYPRLCLIQIAIPGDIACIDPLAISDLSPLYEVLYDTRIVKILHACSQDLEIFAHLQGAVPAPIFDTQLAAPLLGLQEQIGYGNFVKEMLGISLDKGQSRTDWSQRPLDRAQLEYAADDVRYLAEIYPRMTERLEGLGRLEWLKPEFEFYQASERYMPDPGRAWQRIRGLEKLRPRALATAQRLAQWREQTAQEKDLPRNWVLKDDVLMDIARLLPDQPERLTKIRNLPGKTIDRYGKIIVQLVQDAADKEPQPLPGWKKRAKPTAQEEALADVLHAQLRLLAERYQINSTVLASRKELLAVVQGEQDIPILKGWRREMAGNELLAIRGGQRIISIDNGRVLVAPASGS